MHENEIKKETKTKDLLDSFTIGTAAKDGALKVYLDMENLPQCELKLKNFFKLKKFVDNLKEM